MKKILSTIVVVVIVLIVFIFIADTINSKETSNGIDHMLANYQMTEVGDNSSVSGILSDLPYAPYVSDIALQTNQLPYEISVNFNGAINDDLDKIEKILTYNATALFALVHNVDMIHFNLGTEDEKVYDFTRLDIEMQYDRPLSYYAQNEYNWANGIVRGPLDMLSILELSDTVIPDAETVTHTLKTDVGYSYDTTLLETYSVPDAMYAFYVINSRTSDDKRYGYGIFDTSTGYYKFKETLEVEASGNGVIVTPIGDDTYFVVENEACEFISIYDSTGNQVTVPVTYYPFVYRYENTSDLELNYDFMNSTGESVQY